MEVLVLLFSAALSFGMLALILLLALVPLAAMFGLPFWYRATWAGWTASGNVSEAFDNVAEGATTGPIQIRPASYLFEKDVDVEHSPAATRAGLEKHFSTTPFAKILASDDDGIAVDLRIPNGLGPGWVAVYKVADRDEGATIHARLRSTFCIPFPVLTFFLALSHHLHQERILKMAAAKGEPKDS